MVEALQSRSQRPVMVLLELLSRRWTLRILWELRGGSMTSRQLRDATGISPTVLQARVNELREAGIVALQGRSGYEMTAIGRELAIAFAPLYDFSLRWADGHDIISDDLT